MPQQKRKPKRNRKATQAPDRFRSPDTAWVRCACGKRGYRDRPAARRQARYLRPGDPNSEALGVYRCTVSLDELYHVGHLNVRADEPNWNDPAAWGE